MTTQYREFAEGVRQLARGVEDLERASTLLNLPPLAGREWYDLLRQKLLPQLHDDAFLVVAVCGGTNIGKSVVFNHLAGFKASATSPLASGTKHPTCLTHPGFAPRHDLGAIFEGFRLEERAEPDAALRDVPDHMLFWLTSDRVPENLLVLDTPDIDSDAQVNWQRADHIRRSADVLVGVLTQQKYNDAAVKQFFRKAALEDKAIIVVFNQCELPDDEAFWPLWLETFCRETGIQPELVYIAPRDRAAAERNALSFFERPWPVQAAENVAAHRDGPGEGRSLAEDLSRLRFAEVKLRTMRGSIRMLLREDAGIPSYLREVEASSGRFQSAAEILSADKLAKLDKWPGLPNALLVGEIRRWWQAQREGWSARVHGFYNTVGQGLMWPVRFASEKIRGEQTPPIQQYREQEWTAILETVEKAFERLTMMSELGNRLLTDRLERVLGGTSRADLLTRLEAAHAQVDLEQDLRDLVATEMRLFKTENPRAHKLLRGLDSAAAVARPAISVGLFVVGFGPAGNAAAQVATDAAITSFVHIVGDVTGGTVAAAVGDTAVSHAAGGTVGYLEAKFRKMQSAFAAKRVAWLLGQLNEHLWGTLLEELYGGAAVAQSEPFVRVRRQLEILGRQFKAEQQRSVA